MPSHLGRYELLRPIGRGGMAEVWLARHRGAGGVEKRVVVKRILRERIADPRFLDLFVSEAQISMALSHKNIVPTFDFGRVGDELFLVMEYVKGTNLAEAMRQAKRKNLQPSASLACHIAFEACQALEYAHGYKDPEGVAKRIAHRDVTPANLLLSTAGEVKLGDFGLAQATVDADKAEGTTRGTPRYMAPEQANAGVVGPPADIFALGLILRDCLLFDVFRQGDVEAQLRAAKEPVPPMPTRISEDMRAICDKATQFDPKDRYQNAKEMSEDLDRALLHARMDEPDDRRPMPERLTDWLASVREVSADGKPVKAKTPAGEIVTYLDHGVDEVLAGLGDATMRSMAATGLESSAPSPDASTEEPSKPESNVPDEPQDSAPPAKARTPWLAAAALLVVPAAAIAYVVTSDSTKAEDSQAPRPVAVTSMDAGLAPESATDAMTLAPTIADAGSPATPVIADARPTKADAKRHAKPTPRPAATPALGTLRISTAPWATVTVVGRSESCSETPCQLQLPEGSHQLELRNPVAGLKKVVRVKVRADKVVKLHEVLEAAPR